MITSTYLTILTSLCASVIAAPSPVLPVDSLHIISALKNLTLPSTFSLSHDGHSNLPPDPYEYPVEGTDVSVIFRNFTTPIERPGFLNEIYLQASGDIVIHRPYLKKRIGKPLDYQWGNVELTLAPSPRMRWRDWSYALEAFWMWKTTFEAVDLNFDIKIGQVIMGRARLMNIPPF